MRPYSLFSLCLMGTVIAGCGGSNGDGGSRTVAEEQTIPAARYAERADKLCRDLAADVLAEQLTVIAAFRRKFEALGMPNEHRDDAQRLLEKSRSAEGELEQVVSALKAADEGTARAALQRYFGFSQQSASIARDSELNFAACGVGA